MDSERVNQLKVAEKAMKDVLSKTEANSIYCPTIVEILLRINGLIRIEGKETNGHWRIGDKDENPS